MKLLLFDQNLSPRLVTRLVDLYPGSAHVDALGSIRTLAGNLSSRLIAELH